MKIVILIVIVLAVGLIVFCAYMGAFIGVAISEQKMGPYYFVYREMTGTDFSQVGKITTEINDRLKAGGFQSAKPFDVFYPEGSGTSNEIGFIIPEDQAALISKLGNEVKSKTIPEQDYMVTEFPYRNPMSFFFGYLKVDPALKKHREEFGYKKVQAISINEGERITYLQPIVK